MTLDLENGASMGSRSLVIGERGAMPENAKWCTNAGVRLEYLVWPAASPRLPPALLVPGMAAPAAYWAQFPTLVSLLGHGSERSVIAISLRGTGASDCPTDGWTPEFQHGDIDAVLRAESVERCHLMGHSVGGVFALGFALGASQRVVSLTMGDFPPVIPAHTEAWARDLESWQEKHFHSDFPRRIVEASQRIDYSMRLGELEVPLLVIQGTAPGAALRDEHLSRFEGARQLRILKVPADHDVFADDSCQVACADFICQAEAT